MTDPLQTLLETLRHHRWTVCFAESCTGGRLAARVTTQAGVSDVFLGGVVTYSNESKQSLLDVQSSSLAQFGAVSECVAQEMAAGARQRFKANWAISVTGVAGPSGGTPEKPVGTVCFGISGRWGSEKIDEAVTKRFEGDRNSIQEQSAEYAMRYLIEWMTKKK